MKIVISNNILLKPLYKNLPDKYNSLILPDIQCINELKKNDFDLALVSPLIFSMIISEEDLRIIPTKVLVMEDYTNSIVIEIKKKRERLEKIYFNNLNEYIVIATKLVLSERFDISPELSDSIEEADIIVNYSNDSVCNNLELSDSFSIDLTEDWYDTFEVPFVAGFWIINANNKQLSFAAAEELVNSFAEDNLQDKELIVDNEDKYQRFGYKHWTWNDEFIKALEEISDVLYYYNYAPHIADIKLLNRKYESLDR